MGALRKVFFPTASLVFLLLTATAHGWAEVPIPPSPTAWVTDTAGLLSPHVVNTLNARLQAYERQSGHQVLVYIAPTTGGVPIEDWAVHAFERWKVGRKGLDDGLALFVFTRDRTVRIEVGYGLESKVPDVLAAHILRSTIEPGLRSGEADRAITAGVDRILALIEGRAPNLGLPDTKANQTAPQLSPAAWLLIGFGVFVFLIIAARNPWLAMYLLIKILSGGRGGGSELPGGERFSGGGGRSGGGGASGRWNGKS